MARHGKPLGLDEIECDLCGSKGIANRMFSHVMGHKHRQQVMKHNHHGDSRYIDRSTDLGGEQGADLGFLHTRVEHVPQIHLEVVG